MGVGQKMIAKLLGHADTGATERYTHVQIEATKPLVEARWERLVGTRLHAVAVRQAPTPAATGTQSADQ